MSVSYSAISYAPNVTYELHERHKNVTSRLLIDGCIAQDFPTDTIKQRLKRCVDYVRTDTNCGPTVAPPVLVIDDHACHGFDHALSDTHFEIDKVHVVDH